MQVLSLETGSKEQFKCHQLNSKETCHLGNIGILDSSLRLSLKEILSDIPEWNTFSLLFFCTWLTVLQVWPPAQIHLTKQVVVSGFLYEVVNVSRDGKRQTQHFVPALYHSLQALLDVAHVGFSLA